MSPDDTAALARRFLAAYSAKDLSTLAALLAPQASSRDWNRQVDGQAAVLAEMQQNFDAARRIDIDVLHLHATASSVAAELRIVVDGVVELDVVDVFEFDAHGRIRALRAYKGLGD